MSTAEAAEAAALPGAGAALAVARNPVRAWLRLFRAELRLVFGRRRNLLLLAVTVVFPVVIGIALRVATPHPQGGNGPGGAFFNQLAGNGVFLTFIALSTLLILVLPVVVAVVAGDSVAGEAGYGTLRYLLAVPAGRTRLLAVKFAAIVVFGLAAAAPIRPPIPIDSTALLGISMSAPFSFLCARQTSSSCKRAGSQVILGGILFRREATTSTSFNSEVGIARLARIFQMRQSASTEANRFWAVLKSI